MESENLGNLERSEARPRVITEEQFRQFLDDRNLSHRRVGDGVFSLGWSGSDAPGDLDIAVVYTVKEILIQATGYSPSIINLEDVELAMQIINDWNKDKLLPKAYFDPSDNSIMGEWSILLDSELGPTPQYVDKYCLEVIPSVMNELFKYCWERLSQSQE